MKHRILSAAVLIALALAGPALAEKGGKKNGRSGGDEARATVRLPVRATVPAPARVIDCPPGLAKKNPPCIPPGQVNKVYPGAASRVYQVGDRIDDIYHRVIYPDRYNLPPLPLGQRYAIIGNQLVRIDSGTLKILDLIRAVDAILD